MSKAIMRSLTFILQGYLIVLAVCLSSCTRSGEAPKDSSPADLRAAEVTATAPVSPDIQSSGQSYAQSSPGPADISQAAQEVQLPGQDNDNVLLNMRSAYDERATTALNRLREGDYAGAAGLFRELSEQDPRAFAGAGISYFRLGDYSNAIAFFEKALAQDSSDFISRKLLAFAYYKADNADSGLRNAEMALSLREDKELRTLCLRLKKEKELQGNFLEEGTAHFKVVYDGYEHGSVDREVLRILDDAYRFVGKELGYFPSGTVTVVLYTNRDFMDITQAPQWSGGIFDGKIKIPVRGIEGRQQMLKKVLFHEYTHAVVHSLTRNCPLWINEGLAEYFSTSYPRKTGQVIPLKQLERSFSGLSGSNAGMAYWESYSAVSYIIEKYGMYRMKDLLMSLSGGAGINPAFKDTFSITYDEFIAGWGKG